VAARNKRDYPLRVLVVNGLEESHANFIVKLPKDPDGDSHVIVRYVHCMTRLANASEFNWDLIFCFSRLSVSAYSDEDRKTLVNPGSVIRLLAGSHIKKCQETPKHVPLPDAPCFVLCYSEWDDVLEAIDPLEQAGLPWTYYADKKELMWFTDWENFSEKGGEKNDSVRPN
jgi:hypothetical protein